MGRYLLRDEQGLIIGEFERIEDALEAKELVSSSTLEEKEDGKRTT